jgi:hypothetical protein
MHKLTLTDEKRLKILELMIHGHIALSGYETDLRAVLLASGGEERPIDGHMVMRLVRAKSITLYDGKPHGEVRS